MNFKDKKEKNVYECIILFFIRRRYKIPVKDIN